MPENRNKAGRFNKGASGNPGGRPKSDLGPLVREFLDQRDKKAGKKRLQVIMDRLYEDKPEILLHYGWGKPTETHEVSMEHSGAVDMRLVAAAREVAKGL